MENGKCKCVPSWRCHSNILIDCHNKHRYINGVYTCENNNRCKLCGIRKDKHFVYHLFVE